MFKYDILSDDHPLILENQKVCGSCKEEKFLFDFSKSVRHRLGRSSRCKECLNSQRRQALRKRGLKRPLGVSKEPNYRREKRRSRSYGLSSISFKTMYDAQNGKCGICFNNMEFLAKTTCVDHDHDNGNIRGILCMKCNLGLGHFEDNIEKMKSAIEYIKKHSVSTTAQESNIINFKILGDK